MCFALASPTLPAQLLATLLIQHERLQGVQSSGVLIIFWLLCVGCAIIPFRSKILSAVAKVRGKRGTQPGPALSRALPQISRSLLGPRLLPSPSPWLPGLCWVSTGSRLGGWGWRTSVTEANGVRCSHCWTSMECRELSRSHFHPYPH